MWSRFLRYLNLKHSLGNQDLRTLMSTRYCLSVVGAQQFSCCSRSHAIGKQLCYKKGKLGHIIRDSMFENPVDDLQRYVETPLLLEDESWFHPSRETMEHSERLFTSGVRPLASASTPNRCPNSGLPEIALLGYSNVGKSSLIKALFYRCPGLKIRTSSKPGHTKTVDFFQVHQGFVMVDMPGYGYMQPESFATTVGAYLNKRLNLRCAFLLFNPEQGIKEEDKVVIKKLESLRIDYALVMTKIDLFSRSQKLRTLLEIRRLRDTFAREYCYQQPFLVSSVTGEGLGYLQAFIAHICRQL